MFKISFRCELRYLSKNIGPQEFILWTYKKPFSFVLFKKKYVTLYVFLKKIWSSVTFQVHSMSASS